MATILGTSGSNVITGTNDLGDVIFARAGNDLVNANAGNDLVFGELGNDVLVGGLGDDRLNGGLGNDTLNGAAGIDTADYSSGTIDPPGPVGPQAYTGATAGVTVNLNLAGTQNTGGGGLDQLVSIENVFGTNFNDILTGNSADNVFSGLAGNDQLLGGNGNDTLNGGSGNDLLNGGAGSDTAAYTSATASVSVNLTLAGAQNTGGGGLDTLLSIENLTGSNFNDTLTGNSGANVLDGRSGNDHLTGGDGNDRLLGGSGNDVLNGGTGSDTADYSSATTGVMVFLDDEHPDGTPQNTGGAGIDTFLSIENLTGSDFNDTLEISGNDAATLNGGNGDDQLWFDHGGGTQNGEAGNDTLRILDAAGTLNGGTGNDRLGAQNGFGGALNGGDGNDQLAVWLPFENFTLNGGAGADTLELGNDGDAILTCDYNAVSDSPAGTGRDKIVGFSEDDRIDLTDIDANELMAGNQAFVFGGSFTAGHLRYVGGVLQGNTDGDAAVEFEIQLVAAPALTVGGAGSDILL